MLKTFYCPKAFKPFAHGAGECDEECLILTMLSDMLYLKS